MFTLVDVVVITRIGPKHRYTQCVDHVVLVFSFVLAHVFATESMATIPKYNVLPLLLVWLLAHMLA